MISINKSLLPRLLVVLVSVEQALIIPPGGREEKIKTVSNKRPKYGDALFLIEEKIILTESDYDENYIFNKIIDLTIDLTGNLYILDDDRILKYNSEGKFLQKIGKKGQGPGEFISPLSLFADESDNLYINDQGKKLILFDHKKNYRDTIVLQYSIPAFPPSQKNFI